MSYKVLIIESDAPNLKLFSEILKYNGYDTLQAKSAAEGIEMAATGNPCLILLDTQIPGWIEMLKIIKSNTSTQNIPNIPVITLFPHVTERDREIFLKLGFLDCIAKPFDPHTLVTTIDKHLKTRIENRNSDG